MPAVNEINMHDVTFAIWLKRPNGIENQVIISKKEVFALSCNDKEFKISLGRDSEWHAHPMPDDDNWYHIVLTLSGTSADLYVNARKVFGKAQSTTFTTSTEGGILIGQENQNLDFLHRITLAHRALPADEILRLYRRGREKPVQDLNTAPGNVFDYDNDTLKNTAMPLQISDTEPTLRDTPPAPLPRVYPFEIKMTNRKDNVAPAIYIVSDLDKTTDVQKIDFEIKNTGADAYQVGTFTLSFRKGTLHEDLTKNNAQTFCDKLKNAVKTAFALPSEPSVDCVEHVGNISFKVQGAAFTFLANTSVTIALSGIYAAPGTGTRTSGYEVKFEAVQKMVGGKPTDPAFFFSRNAVLQVINHQGVSYAPVHFGVLGNNFLLNNHDSQNIAIFMQSLDGRELKISKETKFTFGFYASENKEGKSPGYDGNLAFGNASEVNDISPALPTTDFSPAHKSEVDEHGRRDIIIVPNGEKSASFLTFPFNNIKLSGNSGLVKVHVEVENLPGYWDSTFEVTFIKGPMVMAEGQVGINTLPFKDTALSVQGEEGKTALTVKGGTGKTALSVQGDTHLGGNVDVMGSIGSGDANKSLNVSSNTEFNKNIEVVGTTHLSGDLTIDKGLTVKGTTSLEDGLSLSRGSHISPFPTAMCVAYAEFDIITENKNKVFKIRNKGFNIESMKIERMQEPIPMSDDFDTYCALNTYLKSGENGDYYNYFLIFNGPRYNFDLGTRFESIGNKHYLSQRTTELNLAEQSTDIKEGNIWIFLYR